MSEKGRQVHQARDITWERMMSYNEERPHDALGKIPPAVYRGHWRLETPL